MLIKDDEPAARTQWRMGRVLQLVEGQDGQVRGARGRETVEGRETVICT